MEAYKVVFDGKRAVVIVVGWPKPILPVGKSGKKCQTQVDYEQTSDGDWNKLEWLSKSVANEEGLRIVEDRMYY